MAGYPRNLANF